MAVYRIHTNKDYSVMSNYHLKDKRLSLKAKGLLSVMLSLPDSWDYSIAGLVAISKESNAAVESTLKELKETGYLIVTKKYPKETDSGRIEYVYDIYESPQSAKKQGGGFQGLEFQGVEFQGVENQGQLNTKELNTNKLNTKNKYKKKQTKNYDKIIATVEDTELAELYYEFIEMRELIKAPMTDRALITLMNKVVNLEPNSIQRQKQLLETAIMHNWKSVYPIKDEEQNKSQTAMNSLQELHELFSEEE